MTSFNYPIRWSGEILKHCEYDGTFTVDMNENTQTFEQSLSIKNEDIKETQKKMDERGEVKVSPKTIPWTT